MSTTEMAHPVEALIHEGKLDEAEKALSSASAEEKDLFAAMIAEGRGDWETAANAYETILDNDPQESEAAFRLARLADLRGDDELALDLYEQVALATPAPVNALLNLAVLYEDMGRYQEALDCVRRVIEEHPEHSRAKIFEQDICSSLDMYYDEERERTREKRNAILEMPISEFELSVRSRNCLKQMDIHTLGDLLRTTAAELLSYKNFGETSLREIETMLTQKGLRIGQLLEEPEPDVSQFAVAGESDSSQAGIYGRSVAELELSVRARKCLMRLGVATIGELCSRSEPELLSIKNFGMTSLSEIKKRLSELGLSLKA